jgi:Na+/H+ antiporter
MIHNYILISITVIFAVLLLVMLGQKLRIAYPIFLVIAGLIISLIPGIPHFQLHPDVVFLIFLPPILFEAAWFTSWKDFWKWRRPIFLLAVGLVLITSLVTAYVSTVLIPGMTLALGFLLGGINSPPDAVAATSILKHLKIPKRINTILEGESLVNDATSLIVFKFALAAVFTGQFVVQTAIVDFFVMGGMGVVIGLTLGFVFAWLMRWLPSNSNIDTVLTLIIPYVIYISAEHFHFSGVMAVVSGGLVMSYNANCFLSHTTRIQAGNVWSTLIFMMNAFVFILIGLALPVVVEGLKEYTIVDGIRYAVIIGGIMIVTRIAWAYIIAFVPRMLFKSIRDKEPSPGWKGPFVISFAAMRGVVSLASALSIPLVLPSGEAFPHRNIILFVTFVIILITLVGQGLILPLLLRLINIKEIDETIPEEKQEAIIVQRMKKKALETITSQHAAEIQQNSLVNHMKRKLESEVTLIDDKMHCIKNADHHLEAMAVSRDIHRKMINTQRNELRVVRHEKVFEENVIRHLEMQLDLDEAKLTGFEHG